MKSSDKKKTLLFFLCIYFLIGFILLHYVFWRVYHCGAARLPFDLHIIIIIIFLSVSLGGVRKKRRSFSSIRSFIHGFCFIGISFFSLYPPVIFFSVLVNLFISFVSPPCHLTMMSASRFAYVIFCRDASSSRVFFSIRCTALRRVGFYIYF